jgi:hypothetical protein
MAAAYNTAHNERRSKMRVYEIKYQYEDREYTVFEYSRCRNFPQQVLNRIESLVYAGATITGLKENANDL